MSGSGDIGLAHVNHDRNAERTGDRLRPPQRLEVVRRRRRLRQPRLDADDEVAMPLDGVARGRDVDVGEVLGVAVGDDAGFRPMLISTRIRSAAPPSRDGDDSSMRSAPCEPASTSTVTPSARQSGGTVLLAAGVGVDVDQARARPACRARRSYWRRPGEPGRPRQSCRRRSRRPRPIEAAADRSPVRLINRPVGPSRVQFGQPREIGERAAPAAAADRNCGE